MSKVVRVHEHGGPDVLRIEELEVGRPGTGEVRVRCQRTIERVATMKSNGDSKYGHSK
jgi:hypothetical protein